LKADAADVEPVPPDDVDKGVPVTVNPVNDGLAVVCKSCDVLIANVFAVTECIAMPLLDVKVNDALVGDIEPLVPLISAVAALALPKAALACANAGAICGATLLAEAKAELA
jgi:hypothetical protein